MGDHRYKRVAAGMYASSAGVEIDRDGRDWKVYLPHVRPGYSRGVRLAATRSTLREAKTAGDILLRNLVEAAHAEALSEYFDRELEATAAARSAEVDTRTAKYDALQRDLAAALAAVPDSIRPDVYLEVAPDVFDLLGVPFPERLRGSRATYAGRPVGIDTDLEPGAWRMRAFLLGTVAHSQLDAHAILRRVLAEIDAQETGEAGSVRYAQAVLAVKLAAADLGVDL